MKLRKRGNTVSIYGNPIWLFRTKSSGAVLHIQAFTGSTITLSKNSIVIAVLPASAGIVNPDVTGASDWYYIVSSANFGLWNVSAEKEGNTKYGSANITSEIQYDVILPTQRLWVYYEGDTLGYIWDTNLGSGATFNLQSDRAELYAPASRYARAAIHTTFDLTNYNSLSENIVSRNNSDNRNYLYAGQTQWDESNHATRNSVGVATLDISGFTGEYYIGLYTWFSHRFAVNQIYLDP